MFGSALAGDFLPPAYSSPAVHRMKPKNLDRQIIQVVRHASDQCGLFIESSSCFGLTGPKSRLLPIDLRLVNCASPDFLVLPILTHLHHYTMNMAIPSLPPLPRTLILDYYDSCKLPKSD